jgi:hypothetical protein
MEPTCSLPCSQQPTTRHWIQSTSSHPVFVSHILILFFVVTPSYSKWSFSGSCTTTLYALLFSPYLPHTQQFHPFRSDFTQKIKLKPEIVIVIKVRIFGALNTLHLHYKDHPHNLQTSNVFRFSTVTLLDFPYIVIYESVWPGEFLI